MKGNRTLKRFLAVVMAVVFTVTGITFTPSENVSAASAQLTYESGGNTSTYTLSFDTSTWTGMVISGDQGAGWFVFNWDAGLVMDSTSATINGTPVSIAMNPYAQSYISAYVSLTDIRGLSLADGTYNVVITGTRGGDTYTQNMSLKIETEASGGWTTMTDSGFNGDSTNNKNYRTYYSNGKSLKYKVGDDDKLHIKNFNSGNIGDWYIGGPSGALTAGVTYTVTFTFTSDTAINNCSMRNGIYYVGPYSSWSGFNIVAGTNTYTFNVTPSANTSERVCIHFNGNAVPSGTEFTFTNFSCVEAATTSAAPTTTAEPTTAAPEGNLAAGKTWTGWSDAGGGWYDYGTTSHAENGYVFPSTNIRWFWYAIQTKLTSLSFTGNKEYTCSFSVTTSARKAFSIDPNADNTRFFTQSASTAYWNTWIDNGDGTYTYNYKGTYTNSTNITRDFRLCWGYINNNECVNSGIGNDSSDNYGVNANDRMSFDVSAFVITPTSEWVDPSTQTPVDPSDVDAAESDDRGETIDVDITADSTAPAGEKYNVYIDSVKVGDKVNAGSHSFDARVGTHTVVVKGVVGSTESTGVTVSNVTVDWHKAGNWVSGPADYEFYEEGSYGKVDYKGSNLSNMAVRVDASSGTILSDYGTQMRIENADLYSDLTDGRKYTLTYTFRSSQAGHIAWIQQPTDYYGLADDITVTAGTNTITKTFVYDSNQDISGGNTNYLVLDLSGLPAGTVLDQFTTNAVLTDWQPVTKGGQGQSVGTNVSMYCYDDADHALDYHKNTTNYANLRAKVVTNTTPGTSSSDSQLQIIIPNTAIYTQDSEGHSLVQGNQYELTMSYTSSAVGTMRIDANPYGGATAAATASYGNTISKTFIYDNDEGETSGANTVIHLKGFSANTEISNISFTITPKEWVEVLYDETAVTVGNSAVWCGDDNSGYSHNWAYRRTATDYDDMQAKIISNAASSAAELSDAADYYGMQIKIPNTSIFTAANNGGENLIPGGKYKIAFSYKTTAAGTMRFETNGITSPAKADSTGLAPQVNTIQSAVFTYDSALVANDKYTYIYLTGFPTDAVLSDFTFALTGGALPAEGLSIARTSDSAGTVTFSAPSGASSSQRYNVYVDGSPYESLQGVTAGTHTISAGVGYSTDHTIEVKAVVDGIESSGVSGTMDKWITASTTNDWVDVGDYSYKIATNFEAKYTTHNGSNPFSIKAVTGDGTLYGGQYVLGKKFTGLTQNSIYDYSFEFSRDTNVGGSGTTVYLKAEFRDANGSVVGSVQDLGSKVYTSTESQAFTGSVTVPTGATQVRIYAVPAWGSTNEVFAIAAASLTGGVLDPVDVSAKRTNVDAGVVYYSNPSGVTQSYNIYVDGVQVATNREQGSYNLSNIPTVVSGSIHTYNVTVKGVANGVESAGVTVTVDEWITGTADGNWRDVYAYAYNTDSTNTIKYSWSRSPYAFSVKLGEADGSNAKPYKVGINKQAVAEGAVYKLSTSLVRSKQDGAAIDFMVDYYDSSDNYISTATIEGGVATVSGALTDYSHTFTVPTGNSIAKARVYARPCWGGEGETIDITSMTMTGGALNPTVLSASRLNDNAAAITFGHPTGESTEYAQQYKIYVNNVLYSETKFNPGTTNVNVPVIVEGSVVDPYTIKVTGVKDNVESTGATIDVDRWITGYPGSTPDGSWQAVWGYAYACNASNTIKYTEHNSTYPFSVKLGESDATNAQPYKVGLIPQNVNEGGVYKLSTVLHRSLNQNADAVFWVDYYDSSDALITSSQIGVGTFSSGDLTYNNTFTVPTGQSIAKARVYVKPAWGTANEVISIESMTLTGGAFDPVISSYNRLSDNSGNVIVANPTVGGVARGETYNIYVDGTLVSSGNYPGTIAISDIPVIVNNQVHDYTIKVTGVYYGVESAGTTSTFTIDKWITGTATNNWINVAGGDSNTYSYKVATTNSIKYTTHNGVYPLSFKFGENDGYDSRPYYIGLPTRNVLEGATYQLDATINRTKLDGAAVQFYVDYYDSSDALVSTATIGTAQSTVAGALTYSNTFEVPTGQSIAKARVYCRPLYGGTNEEFSISSMTVTGGVLNPVGVYTHRLSESQGRVHFSNDTGGTGLFNVYVDGTLVNQTPAWEGHIDLDYPDYVNNQVKTYEVVVKGVDANGIESSGVTVTLDKWIDSDSTKGVWQTPATPGDYSYKMTDDVNHEGVYSRHDGHDFSFKATNGQEWGYYIASSLRTVTAGAQYAYSVTFNSSKSGGGRTFYYYIEDSSGNRLTFTPTGGSAGTETSGVTAAADGNITFTGTVDVPSGITQIRLCAQSWGTTTNEVIAIDNATLTLQEVWNTATNNQWVDVNDFGYYMETYDNDPSTLNGEYSTSYSSYPLSIRGDLGGTNLYGGRYRVGTRLLSVEEDTPYNYEIGFHRTKADLTGTKMTVIALFGDGTKVDLGVTDIDNEGNLVVTPATGSPNFAAYMDGNDNIICSGTVNTPMGVETMRIYAQFSWEGANEKFSVMNYEITSIPAFDLVNDGSNVYADWDDDIFADAETLKYTSEGTVITEDISSVTNYSFTTAGHYPDNKTEVLLLDDNDEVIGRKVALADLTITRVTCNSGGPINSNTNNSINIIFKNIGVARVNTGGENLYAKATTGDDWYNYTYRRDMTLMPMSEYTVDVYGFRPMEPGKYTIKTSINDKTEIRESNYNNNRRTDTFVVRTQIEDDTAVLGFQINTNKAEGSPSEFNPCYRAVCRASKRVYPEGGPSEGYAVTGYGLLYSLTDAADMSKPLDELKFAADGGRVGAEGETYFKSYAADGSMDYEGWSTHDSQYNPTNSNYYALTIYDLYYTTQSYETVFTYRSYLQYEDNQGVTHTVYPKDVYSASLYEIAEDLYKYQKMPTEVGHKFMYDNILNIVSMKHNNADIGKAMLTALGVPKGARTDDYYMANMCYKDIYYYALCTNGYMYADYSENDEGGGKVAEPPYTHDHEFQSIQLDKSTNPNRTSAILLSRLNTATATSYETIPDWIRGCVGKTVNGKDMTQYQGMYKKKAYSWDSNLDKDYGSE